MWIFVLLLISWVFLEKLFIVCLYFFIYLLVCKKKKIVGLWYMFLGLYMFMCLMIDFIRVKCYIRDFFGIE